MSVCGVSTRVHIESGKVESGNKRVKIRAIVPSVRGGNSMGGGHKLK